MEEDERQTRTKFWAQTDEVWRAHQHYIGAEDSIREHVVRGFDLITE